MNHYSINWKLIPEDKRQALLTWLLSHKSNNAVVIHYNKCGNNVQIFRVTLLLSKDQANSIRLNTNAFAVRSI